MITPRQCRAARVLLDWTQKDLAAQAKINLAVVARFEREEVDTRSQAVIAMEKAVRRAGIDLLYPDQHGGEGVRFIRGKG